ncbi:23S rRNA (uracil(747)-C(5))-methyltransferase RlmC [Isoptericola sp. b441]|uniref:23S rRNA (Uracil(747)-C(5))-methyltransferase RlmC n=1 Tax=Actinotalea lenta TaxID=3064654 RepID=A0ABT9D7Z8_9CELL|nr:23S rRNA (uracil(747)-C(5))-methyltransferase RlmC [Isoptericola sp. b441]MDO8107000.1 23S rRNA (uracil(747)-C(5))-methyltransferase RlmC [Isoptericola sp. b441]
MRCDYYDAALCRSCTLLRVDYPDQLSGKQARARAAIGDHPGLVWEPAVASAEHGFRNKAKMVVAGTVDEPTLGILDATGHGTDLRRCPLHTPGIVAALPTLAAFVARAGLTPYDVTTRRGELKYVLVTEGDGLMVRFVLRSTEALARVRKHLPWLLQELEPAVVSANIQPLHKAVLEGDVEIPLVGEQLAMPVGDVVLHLQPRSFFQTNTTVAAALYSDARAWTRDLPARTAWDLFCGVGGFALHIAHPGREVVGVELSEEAVASAARSRDGSGTEVDVRFVAGDALAFARDAERAPDLVVVNPPRRGITELAGWLEASRVRHVLYSSCNVDSLAQDLNAMPSLVPRRARVFDMFPHTAHHEVLVLLERAVRA